MRGVIGRNQDPEVVAYHTPGDPASHAIGAVIKAARETITPFHDADAALASRAQALTALKAEPPAL